MSELFWFSDEQWARIAPLLPTNTRGMKRVDDRRVLSGIVHVLKSGGRWGDCPREYGPKKTLYNRFVRWAERGVWERIFSALAGAEGVPDRLMIDSTSIKVHRCARGAKGGPRPMLLVAAKVDLTRRSTSSPMGAADPASSS
jgi:mannitol 2-dehydrogenase